MSDQPLYLVFERLQDGQLDLMANDHAVSAEKAVKQAVGAPVRTQQANPMGRYTAVKTEHWQEFAEA